MKRRLAACAGTALALTIATWAAPPADAAGRDARVDWSAGPVTHGIGYAREGGSDRVREVQRRLRALGYRPGAVDGLFGPRTSRATRRFQRRSGLRVDAVVGPRTLTALRSRDVVRPTTRRGTPAARPAPLEPPEPLRQAPARAPSPGDGGPSASLLALLALAAAGTLAAGLLHRTRHRHAPARTDEIVARSAADLAPRWTKEEVRERTDHTDEVLTPRLPLAATVRRPER
jgi:peptidoglycan hydrolase-like protein with peptidoglycan-binding domain